MVSRYLRPRSMTRQ